LTLSYHPTPTHSPPLSLHDALPIFDRYLIREILPPLLIALVGLTFALMMPPILKDGEQLVAKGVAWTTILRALLTLTPSALCVRSEEHTSELQSRGHLVCRLLLEKK